MALVQLSAVPVLVRLQDGNKVEVMADSWTSVTDLEKQVGIGVALKTSCRHAWSYILFLVFPCGCSSCSYLLYVSGLHTTARDRVHWKCVVSSVHELFEVTGKG